MMRVYHGNLATPRMGNDPRANHAISHSNTGHANPFRNTTLTTRRTPAVVDTGFIAVAD
jgi:hypothetical protein